MGSKNLYGATALEAKYACTPALSLLLGFSFIAGAKSDLTRPPMLGKLVDVSGYRVHIYCTGEGSTTVMVASAGFSFDWGLVQPEVPGRGKEDSSLIAIPEHR